MSDELREAIRRVEHNYRSGRLAPGNGIPKVLEAARAHLGCGQGETYSEREVEEVARIYRAVVSSILDGDDQGMTVGDLHDAAARAVLDWLIFTGWRRVEAHPEGENDVKETWDYLEFTLATRGIPATVEETTTDDYEADPWLPAPNTEAVQITVTKDDADRLCSLLVDRRLVDYGSGVPVGSGEDG